MPLRKSDPIDKWIRDFIDSDDIRFKGKSKAERIDMAKGAYYAAQKEELEKGKDDPCWKDYVQLGTKKKNGKEVPNCVPKEGVNEEVAANSVAAGGIDLNPTGIYKKRDKRKREDTDTMYRRNTGLSSLKAWLNQVEKVKEKERQKQIEE